MVTQARPAPGRKGGPVRDAFNRLAVADPGEPLGYVDGTNLYEYVGSDPLGATDPMGLATEPTTQPTTQLTSVEERYRAGQYEGGEYWPKFCVDPNEGVAIRVSLTPGAGAVG